MPAPKKITAIVAGSTIQINVEVFAECPAGQYAYTIDEERDRLLAEAVTAERKRWAAPVLRLIELARENTDDASEWDKAISDVEAIFGITPENAAD